MKCLVLSFTYGLIVFFLSIPAVFAENYPAGGIVFHNASGKTITAEVTTIGKIQITAQQEKNVSYSTLSQVCSSSPTHCTTHFYVDNEPVGYATINAQTGKLLDMKVMMRVGTTKDQKVLRSVTIY